MNKEEILDDLNQLKEMFYRLLDDKKQFVKWLEDYYGDLKLLICIHSHNKEQLLKIEAQLELIAEVLKYFNENMNLTIKKPL